MPSASEPALFLPGALPTRSGPTWANWLQSGWSPPRRTSPMGRCATFAGTTHRPSAGRPGQQATALPPFRDSHRCASGGNFGDGGLAEISNRWQRCSFTNTCTITSLASGSSWVSYMDLAPAAKEDLSGSETPTATCSSRCALPASHLPRV